jgi:hypothetical protein
VSLIGAEFLDKATATPIELTVRANSGYGFVREVVAAGGTVVRMTKISEVSTGANDWTLVIYSVRPRFRLREQG